MGMTCVSWCGVRGHGKTGTYAYDSVGMRSALLLGMKTMRFWATIEILKGQGAAIVALFDSTGEWSGAGRIECRSGRASDLYELGYMQPMLST